MLDSRNERLWNGRFWQVKRPFVRKQHPVNDKEKIESLSVLESGSGRGRLAIHRGKPRHQGVGGVCELRGVRPAAFIPSEPNAAVASVTNVTSFRTPRRLRRRISRYIAVISVIRVERA